MPYETNTAANIVNGINVDDVNALIESVKENPASALTNWKVKSEWRGRTHNRTRVEGFGLGGEFIARSFTIDIDEPEQLGGANRFANPQEHLLAAVNSCMMVGFTALCALQGIRLDKLEMETSGEIDLRGFLGLNENVPAGYPSLTTVVRVSGDATPEKFEEIMSMVRSTSPNYFNITRAIALNANLVVD